MPSAEHNWGRVFWSNPFKKGKEIREEPKKHFNSSTPVHPPTLKNLNLNCVKLSHENDTIGLLQAHIGLHLELKGVLSARPNTPNNGHPPIMALSWYGTLNGKESLNYFPADFWFLVFVVELNDRSVSCVQLITSWLRCLLALLWSRVDGYRRFQRYSMSCPFQKIVLDPSKSWLPPRDEMFTFYDRGCPAIRANKATKIKGRIILFTKIFMLPTAEER